MTATDRIFFDGNYHKDVFFDGHYHKEAWLNGELVWQKIQDFSFQIRVMGYFSAYFTVYEGTFDIDWGDGTEKEHCEIKYPDITEISHNYGLSLNSDYVIKISGNIKAMIFPSYYQENSGRVPITSWIFKIITPVLPGFGDAYSIYPNENPRVVAPFFKNAIRLQSIPQDIFYNCKHATYFTETFSGCAQLKAIPEGLFRRHLKTAKGINSMFKDCTSLTSIPLTLFDGMENLENVSSAFSGCTNITGKLPELWKIPSITSHEGCYRGCTKASNYSEVPAGWK